MDNKVRLHQLIEQAAKCFSSTNRYLVEFIGFLADFLCGYGVIVPPLRIGDKVYFILPDEIVDEGGDPICELTVTEVGQRGFWVSACDPAEDDMQTLPRGMSSARPNFSADQRRKRSCLQNEIT